MRHLSTRRESSCSWWGLACHTYNTPLHIVTYSRFTEGTSRRSLCPIFSLTLLLAAEPMNTVLEIPQNLQDFRINHVLGQTSRPCTTFVCNLRRVGSRGDSLRSDTSWVHQNYRWACPFVYWSTGLQPHSSHTTRHQLGTRPLLLGIDEQC